MDNKVFLDEAGLGEVGKVISKHYASKEDLSKVDVAEQLVDYAKKNDLDNKVDKVEGKSLSSNDYTSEDKAKVDAIPENPKYTDTTYDLSGYATKDDLANIDTNVDLTDYAKKAETLNKETDKFDYVKLTWGDAGRPINLSNFEQFDTQYMTPYAVQSLINRMANQSTDIGDRCNHLGAKLCQKVDKIDGKQLSTQDYTNEDRRKLQAMPAPVFLEKEQYESFSEQEKMDNSKLYYIYAERQQ